MPITCVEAVGSRKLKVYRRDGNLEKNFVRLYTVQGSNDPADPDVLAQGPQDGEAYSERSHDLYVISREYEILPSVAPAMRLTVTYGPADRLPAAATPDEPEYELDLMAETVKIEKALSQVNYPASASDVGKLIGVNGDKVEGVDAYFPRGNYIESREMNKLDSAYRALLMSLGGCVNNATWKGWKKGEVLFLGAKARRKGRGAWKLSYHFAIQTNATVVVEVDVAGNQNVEKEGWQYLWYRRKIKKDGAQNKTVSVIQSAHVATIYPAVDFGQLGLGSK